MEMCLGCCRSTDEARLLKRADAELSLLSFPDSPLRGPSSWGALSVPTPTGAHSPHIVTGGYSLPTSRVENKSSDAPED